VNLRGEYVDVKIEGSNNSGQWQTFDVGSSHVIIGVYGVLDDMPIIRGLGFILLARE
jgi:hypothetical protein